MNNDKENIRENIYKFLNDYLLTTGCILFLILWTIGLWFEAHGGRL